MRTKHLCVLIDKRTKGEISTVRHGENFIAQKWKANYTVREAELIADTKLRPVMTKSVSETLL